MKARKYKYQLIHEEEAFLIINKPAHLSVVPDRTEDNTSLKQMLDRKFGRVWVVHRLDRNTTGALVFARNAEVHRHLSIQFQERKVDKVYNAIVYGRPQEEEGTIETFVSDYPDRKGRYHVRKAGKIAITHYKVLEELSNNYYLLELKIVTGRRHQIRLHCEHAGFPLAADPVYGHEPAFYLSQIKRKFQLGKFKEEYPLLDRNSLHARKLAFDHPISGERVQFEAPHFKDFLAVLNQLGKWG